MWPSMSSHLGLTYFFFKMAIYKNWLINECAIINLVVIPDSRFFFWQVEEHTFLMISVKKMISPQSLASSDWWL